MIAALIALFVVISMVAILAIHWPFFEERTNAAPQSSLLVELDRLYYEKERLIDNLQDLEHDHVLKKIDHADYNELKNKLLGQTAHIYTMLKHLEDTNPILKAIEHDLKRVEKEMH